jgi:dCMP deaminase
MTWDDYHWSIAEAVAQKSTCPRLSVGCVIIDPESNFVLATGYNGAPRGTEHCGEACRTRKVGEDRDKCKAVHAELNAIVSAARSGQRLDGSHAFQTISPCLTCSRIIIQAGIREVHAMELYPNAEAIDLLYAGGVSLFVKGMES